MAIITLYLPLIFTILGCSEKVRYIKTPCPKLVTFARDHNVSMFHEKLKLSVPLVDDNTTRTLLNLNDEKYDFLKMNVWGFVKLTELKSLSVMIQKLKARGIDDNEILELYEEMMKEYNEP